MSTDNAAQPRSARPKLAILLWSICFAAIFAFGWFKSSENRRDETAIQSWQLRFHQLQQDGDAEFERLKNRFAGLQGTPSSQLRLGQELNGRQPFSTDEETGEAKYSWSDPTYGCRFWFTFRDGILVGLNGHWGTGELLAVYPQPIYHARENSAEVVRRSVLKIGT